MSDAPMSAPPTRNLTTLIGGLYFEICVLVFCAAILSQTGRTSGPVFDVVGPDLLPTTVAWIVACLVCCQVVVHLFGWRRGVPDAAVVSPNETITGQLVAVVFGVITIAYAAVLSNELVPFYLATAVYLTACTMLLARRLNWRDMLVGALLGIVMGVGMQWLFTSVFIIDLPT